MVLARLIIELIRILMPGMYSILPIMIFMVDLDWLFDLSVVNGNVWMAFLVYWPIHVVLLVGAVLSVAAFKWILIGRFVPGETPLWSSFVWRGELIVALCESVADPSFCNGLRGTPFAAWWLRLLGTKVGNYCYIDSLQMTEFDLIEIGDEVAIGRDATIQTHLFEDRIMKMSTVTIGNGASLSAFSVALYDSSIGEGASLHSLTLLMKGESIPAWTMWHGTPAKRYLDVDILTTVCTNDGERGLCEPCSCSTCSD